MAVYFVGDIQGCYKELKLLLQQVNFSADNDELWVAGDMVARGPDSYKTVKYLMSLGDSVKAVLGNHDLHFLATYAGIKKPKANDFLDELLAAPEIDEIISWLANTPLLRKLPEEKVYMSHAGLSPQWSLKEAKDCAEFAHKKLKGKKREQWLSIMYGERPNSWSQVNNKEEKFRFTINALTRMRYCFADGSLEFLCKYPPAKAPTNLVPWFNVPNKALSKCHWIFGHWAALEGKAKKKNVYPLDTGCVWGGHLTLLRWHDKQYFKQPAFKNCP
ncbi:symmetrical bis(5'-nucleosyl)-tetraphosphatase [Thalassotalea marina]|uniref:Bis(5'-nucleosyl)-tetraphosphatase, symmetrical n=1 Tax=Thalassotalea marina TaxID=1673741 RepID=A0A919EH16_9GAMM|nr:symmetrical bis(5'-nucleosyl)-tetraphosphatase [Thalassotalea marina]GHF78380.1 bis(5'-nucleosyl)-tetraphosphatase, symmetrical [Thalassotalea marina]